MRRARISTALLSVMLMGGAPALAQSVQTVQFAHGTSSKTMPGSIAGDTYVDYRVNAAKGQMLNVDIKRQSGSAYFNVTPPGADAAVHIGSSDGDSYTGPITVSGNQVIRVYQMRATGRRGETARYVLTVGVGGRPDRAAAPRPSSDAKVAGTDFNATAQVPCALGAGAPLGRCPAGVKRFPSGEATVTVTLPGGKVRHIYFTRGKPDSTDNPQGRFSAMRRGDTNVILTGAESYEIPDAFVLGG